VITERNQLFRKSALERLSSPDQLDTRLKLVSYRRWLLLALPALLIALALYGAWMAGAL
jgi:HlyD family secretion protein